jgi:hypothetical protein
LFTLKQPTATEILHVYMYIFACVGSRRGYPISARGRGAAIWHTGPPPSSHPLMDEGHMHSNNNNQQPTTPARWTLEFSHTPTILRRISSRIFRTRGSSKWTSCCKNDSTVLFFCRFTFKNVHQLLLLLLLLHTCTYTQHTHIQLYTSLYLYIYIYTSAYCHPLKKECRIDAKGSKRTEKCESGLWIGLWLLIGHSRTPITLAHLKEHLSHHPFPL